MCFYTDPAPPTIQDMQSFESPFLICLFFWMWFDFGYPFTDSKKSLKQKMLTLPRSSLLVKNIRVNPKSQVIW